MNIESDVKIYQLGAMRDAADRVNRVGMIDFGNGRKTATLEFKGGRSHMEDRVLVIPELYDDTNLVAVFDGHGGSEVADFLKINTEKVFFDKLWRNNALPKISLEQTINELDDQIEEKPELKHAGAAAVFAIVETDKLVVANVGDCEAVLNRNGKAMVLTEKHNLKSETELNKIIINGGIVSENGYLSVSTSRGSFDFALTRTLGDKDILEPHISSEPSMIEIDLEEGDTELILASDGLWSVVDYQDAVDVVRASSDSVEAVSNLKQLAIENKSMDNISVVVVKLK